MKKHTRRVHTVRARFKMGQHVRISKEKTKFKKGAEKNFFGKYFELTKLLREYPGLFTSWKI